jgi:hypothetical protein
LSIPALVTGGEKANGEVFGQQIKVVVSDATVVIVKNTRALSARRKSERDN